MWVQCSGAVRLSFGPRTRAQSLPLSSCFYSSPYLVDVVRHSVSGTRFMHTARHSHANANNNKCFYVLSCRRAAKVSAVGKLWISFAFFQNAKLSVYGLLLQRTKQANEDQKRERKNALFSASMPSPPPYFCCLVSFARRILSSVWRVPAKGGTNARSY